MSHTRAALRTGWVLVLLLLAMLAFSARAMPAFAAGQNRVVQPRVVVILFDTNISPWKAQLPVERRAALSYARALPADVEIGLIVFGDSWTPVLEPTASRAKLSAALAAARPAGATSNGLAAALSGAAAMVRGLGAASQGRLLVLTDGEYMKQPRQTVAIPVDVITWHHDSDDYVHVIQQVASASGGHSASPGKAGGLTKFLPPKPHVTSAPAGPSAAPRWHVTKRLLDVLAVVFAALLGLALLAGRSLRPANRRPHLVSQIERYGPQAVATAASEVEQQGKLATSAVGLMSQVLATAKSEPRLAQRLDHAGISRAPAEWALLGLCICAGMAALFTVALGDAFIGVVLGALFGWVVMRLVLSFKISRRRAAFDDQLPNVLQLVTGSLQTGLSLSQALDAVVREDAQPASGEFSRALGEVRLGVDLDVALDGVASRLNSADLRWVIMAIRIQRETGGNLAEVLRNTIATMRERAYLRRQVRSLSAEGRLSAYVLIALPLLIGGWLFYSNPRYMHPLFSTLFGVTLLIIASILVVIGAFWMRNLIKVEA